MPAEYLIPKSINTPTFTLGGIDDPIWCLYRYSEDDIEGGLPSVLAQTATSYTRLLRIVHDTSTVFYDGAGTRIYSREVLQHYTRYLTWFDELSPEIKDIYDDVPIVPHVLSLQYDHLSLPRISSLISVTAFSIIRLWYFSSVHSSMFKPSHLQQSHTSHPSPTPMLGKALRSSDAIASSTHVVISLRYKHFAPYIIVTSFSALLLAPFRLRKS